MRSEKNNLNHDSLDLRIALIPFAAKDPEIFKSSESWFRQLSVAL